jgi:hypothetical protein
MKALRLCQWLSRAAHNIIVSVINVIPTSDALGQVQAAAYLIAQQFRVER